MVSLVDKALTKEQWNWLNHCNQSLINEFNHWTVRKEGEKHLIILREIGPKENTYYLAPKHLLFALEYELTNYEVHHNQFSIEGSQLKHSYTGSGKVPLLNFYKILSVSVNLDPQVHQLQEQEFTFQPNTRYTRTQLETLLKEATRSCSCGLKDFNSSVCPLFGVFK